MELRDYLRMLRRGWLIVTAFAVLGAILGVAYLQVTPAQYQSTTVILAAPRNAQNIGDLQLGGQYATSAAPTIATLIQSSAVLDPAADDVSRQGDEPIDGASLASRLTVTAQEATSVISLTVSSDDAQEAAAIADAVAASAVDVVPGLVSNDPRANNAPILALQVIQRGAIPTAPISPDQGRVLTLTVVIGLLLGLALTITRQSLDSRILRAEDLRAVTGTKLLAVLPRRRRSKRSPIVVRDQPASPAVEAYRVLRTNLGQAPGDGRRSIVFAPVRGDAFAPRVPVNIAWSIAQAGRRVLLIDLDLRGSAVADLLDLTNIAGSADLLGGNLTLRDVVCHTGQSCLDVVTSGSNSQAPSDLLSGPALEQLVRQAEDEHDVVVLNLPPLLAYSDAAVVSRVATETVVVVRAETRGPEVAAALEVLSNVGVVPRGLVLTGSKNSVVELSRLAPAGTRQTAPATGRGRRVARAIPEAGQ